MVVTREEPPYVMIRWSRLDYGVLSVECEFFYYLVCSNLTPSPTLTVSQPRLTRTRPSPFPRQSWPLLPLTLGAGLVPLNVKGPLWLEKQTPWTLQSQTIFGVPAIFVRFFLANLDLWTWNLEITWKLSSAYIKLLIIG